MDKKNCNYLRIIRSEYYGDDVSLNLNCNCYCTRLKPYKNYSKNGIEVFTDTYDFDGDDVYIFFEDKAQSLGQALLILIDIIKKESIGAYVNHHHIGDLAKLILDNYVGEDAYKNMKENYSFMFKECYSQWGVIRNITTYPACYDDGNNLYYFGEKNGCCALTRKSDVFIKQTVQYLITKNMFELAKAVCDSEHLDFQKESFENKHESLTTQLSNLEKEKKRIVKAIAELKDSLLKLMSEENKRRGGE